MDKQVTGRDVIEEIIKNFLASQEPLLYSTLVPGWFEVYLNGTDYERLRPIFPRITREAEQALEAELVQLNKRGRWSGFLSSKSRKFEKAQPRWEIYLLQEEDEKMEKGHFLVISQLALPSKPELAGGSQTKRVVTKRINEEAPAANKPPDEEPKEESKAYARIQYEDDRGRQTYWMMKPQIVIGRGGREFWTDLKIYTVPDVSREHLRLRYDAALNQFYIKDVSTLGTLVNGERLPSSVEIVGDEKRDMNIEVALPARALISLADAVVLEFEAVNEK